MSTAQKHKLWTSAQKVKLWVAGILFLVALGLSHSTEYFLALFVAAFFIALWALFGSDRRS